jgi:serine/threonine protein kinase
VVKKYDLAKYGASKIVHVMHEINISLSLKHDNIIKTFTYFAYSPSSLWIVQEYAKKGDLVYIQDVYNNKLIPEEVVKTKFMVPLLKALEYIHDKGVIHLDVKPENIVVMEDGTVKLCDFGLAVDTHLHTPNEFLGTPEFMAPELVKLTAEGYTNKVDMWSLGCTIYELLFRYTPFIGNSREETFKNILQSPVHFPLDIFISSGCLMFLTKLLIKTPTSRISAKEALQTPYVKSASNPSHLDLHVQGYPARGLSGRRSV